MYDPWEILPEHLPELTFDLALDESFENSDRVEGRAHFERFERIVLEDEGDTFLLGDDEDDDRSEFEVG